MAPRKPEAGPGGRKKAGRSAAPAAKKTDFRPSREEVLQFIAENPDRSGKRDIAKAFSLKGEARIWLKDLLRDLQDEGQLHKQKKRLIRPGTLPHVVVLEIFGRDSEGGLLARPSEHIGEEPAPVVSIRAPRGGSGPAPGIGDRLLAKVFPTGEASGPAYNGRVMKVFEKRQDAVLGIFRIFKDGTFRIEPVERRQPELIVEPEFRGEARDGDLVEVEPARAGRFGLPRGKVIAVLGSLTSEKAVSMIAIHAHDIPHIFPAAVLEEAEAAKPATMAKREDWRDVPLVTIDPADAKDHDDAVFAEPDPDEKNPGGFIVTVAIADVAAYVRPDSPLDREALKRGNSAISPTASCRCCRSASPTTSARSGKSRTARRSPCA